MTAPDTTTDVTTEALAGPWQAILSDSYGDTMTWADFSSNGLDPDEVRIQIVRGTAAPGRSGQLPGSYLPADRLVRFQYMEEMEEVEARWVQAQAMAAGLNQAAKEQREVFSVWYRSVTPDGKVWCEARDPDEVVEASKGKDCTFWQFPTFTVRAGWQPWDASARTTA